MSEDVMGKLGSFTPAAVDRDALLFAAGRASAKPSQFWKFATAALAVSQCITLGLWFAPKRTEEPSAVPEVKIVEPDEPPTVAPDPYSLFALARGGEPKRADFTAGPSRPPLTAFSSHFQP